MSADPLPQGPVCDVCKAGVSQLQGLLTDSLVVRNYRTLRSIYKHCRNFIKLLLLSLFNVQKLRIAFDGIVLLSFSTGKGQEWSVNGLLFLAVRSGTNRSNV